MFYKNQTHNLLIFSFFLILILTATSANAAARTWDGGAADNKWSTAANWSANTVPVNGDEVIFNATSTKNATIDVNVSASNFSIQSGYTGTITQANGVSVATASVISQSGRTYVGGDGAFTIPQYNLAGGIFQGGTGLVSGNRIIQSGGTFSTAGNVELSQFDLTGGTFNAPAGLMTVVAGFTQTGGTFNPNGGTVKFTGYSNCNFGASATIDVAATLDFYNLQFDFAGCFIRYIANGDTLVVNNDLRLTNGGVNSGRIRLLGNVIIDSSFYPTDNVSRPNAGSTVLELAAPNRNFVINNTSSNAPMLPIEMNAPNSTLTATGTGRLFFGGLTLTDGTVTQPNAVWDFSGYAQSGGTFNGSTAQINVGIGLSGGTFNGGTGLVSGSLTQTGGTFSTAGDMDVSGFAISGGICNAPLGTLDIYNGFTHTGGGTFNARTGTVRTSIRAGAYQAGFDVNATETFNNLQFNGTNNNANHGIGAGDTLVVNGTLTFSGRGASGGSIVANGNVVYENYGAYQNATTLVKFEDTATRTVTLCADSATCGGSYEASIQPTLINNPNITVNAG